MKTVTGQISITTLRQFTCSLYIHGKRAEKFQRDSFPDTYGSVLRAPEGSTLRRLDNQTGNPFWYMKRAGKWEPFTADELLSANKL